ncbi:MAG: hypothetical protein ABJH08_01845 [Balneola sp.]
MHEVLISGKTSFKIQVPYKLYETGEGRAKPLIVYLHGYRQNISKFEKLVKEMMEIEAYHLFIQAPYPIYDETGKTKVHEWGASWYLYDGEQQQFIKSLELASEFIQEVIDNILPNINVSRICLFGYSMGGYLGGYFMLSRWKHVNEAIIIGARIKTEAFEGALEDAKHIKVLALHGSSDKSVLPKPQEKEIQILKEAGFTANFIEVNSGHKLTKPHLNEAITWLKQIGYQS